RLLRKQAGAGLEDLASVEPQRLQFTKAGGGRDAPRAEVLQDVVAEVQRLQAEPGLGAAALGYRPPAPPSVPEGELLQLANVRRAEQGPQTVLAHVVAR